MIPTIKPSYKNNSPISISILNIHHYPAHTHEKEVELVFCLSGNINVITAHDRFSAKAGQMLTIDQEDVHCLYSDTDNLVALLNLDLTKSTKYSFDDLKYRFLACTTQWVRDYSIEHYTKAKDIILALISDFCFGRNYDEKHYQAVYERLINLLVKNFSWPYKSDLDADANDEIKTRLHKINKYVQENYTDKITISQLSKLGNINENYFSQFMKKTSYGGFREMLAYVRCYHAEIMLLTTNYSNEEISNMCGFSSAKYYYRWFKHFWGRTPQQHRKWYKNYSAIEDDYTEYTPAQALPMIERYMTSELIHRVFEDMPRKA